MRALDGCDDEGNKSDAKGPHCLIRSRALRQRTESLAMEVTAMPPGSED